MTELSRYSCHGCDVVAYQDLHDFEVWLDSPGAERDGLCLGAGPTLDAAKAHARATLQQALARLAPKSHDH